MLCCRFVHELIYRRANFQVTIRKPSLPITSPHHCVLALEPAVAAFCGFLEARPGRLGPRLLTMANIS